MATKKNAKTELKLVTGQPVLDEAEAASESGDFQGSDDSYVKVEPVEAAVAETVVELVKAPAKAKKTVKSAKSKKPAETVETIADTIDEKPVVAGKQQILDAAAAVEICRLADTGMSLTAIAKQFGVAPSHVSCITRGVSWQAATGRYYQGRGTKWAATPPATKKVEN